jgi:endogenous inhibitor of DNA gyrase (YacG/DUF329 family)
MKKLKLSEAEVIQNYHEEKIMEEVAKTFNCSGPTIKKILKNNNISLYPTNRKASAWNKVKLDEQEVIDIYNSEMSLRKVANKFNVSPPTIRRILIENDIQPNGKPKYTKESKKKQSERMKQMHKEGKFSGENHWNYQGGKREVPCCICGNITLRFPCQIVNNPVCSEECEIILKREQALNMGLGNICGKDHPNWKNENDVICLNCGKEFHVNYGSHTGKFCSNKCNGEYYSGKNSPNWNNNIKVSVCPQCKKEFRHSRETEYQLCCSKECQTKYYVGERANVWKGGVSLLGARIRMTIPGKEWITAIFERDNYICQECGNIGGYLNAHHIIPFSELLNKNHITSVEEAILCEELWNIDNGITLCKECHKGRHKK